MARAGTLAVTTAPAPTIAQGPMVSPGTTTLGVRLYTLIHTAPDAMVSAAAMNIVLLAIPAIALWAALASSRLWGAGDAAT